MTKEKYFNRSLKQNLPNRCPILNYCSRRALTIYFFNEYKDIDFDNNYVATLNKEGCLPPDFQEKQILLQGEEPIFSKSPRQDSVSFYNMCPEVNLFDNNNSIEFAKGIPCSSGRYDKEETPDHKIIETKHYSECTEFSDYIFKNRDLKIKKPASPNRRRVGISQKLRFEVFQKDNFTCQYCGKTKDDGIKLELDHKTPISAGGTDDYENLTTSCKDCNQGKSNKIIK